MVFAEFDAEVADWRDKWDFDDKMLATCCGQPVKRADTGSSVGKRYATSQVAAVNNDDPPFIPVSAVIFVAK
jgi:hypothetical protein